MSYTTFEYGNLRIVPKTSKGDAKLQVSADVKNTGKRDGDDVVQLYTSVAFTDPNAVSAIPMPVKQLRGFSRVSIPAGKTKTVTFTLEPNELAFWSVSDKSFRVEAGTYTVRVGNSSDQLPLTGTFNLTSSVLYNSIDRKTRPAPPLAK